MHGIISLTTDQQQAFQTVMSGVDTFVTGGAGTGKSALVRKVIHEFEQQGKNIVICAPTGIAAVNVGGTTIHKAFGFSKGPCITEKTSKLTIRTPKLISMADVILIDEISMCRLDMMDAICASILKARQKSSHRIQLVVIGDFCQLPPVIDEKTGERAVLEEYYGRTIGNGYAFQAPGWKDMCFTASILKTVVRQDDNDFIHYLNLLRRGEPSAIRYLNTFASYKPDENSTGLYAYTANVDVINERELRKLPGEMYAFHPVCYGNDADLPDDIRSVYLKTGAKVIVTTNHGELICDNDVFQKDHYNSLHNGSLGTVVQANVNVENPDGDYVVVKLNNGTTYIIYRQIQEIYSFRVDRSGCIYREVTGRMSYMPVKPGYAMTIHRSQGQTFDSIVLDPSCKSSGQLYTAISRLRSINGLHLTRPITKRDLHLNPSVKEFYAHLNEQDYNPTWMRPSVITGNTSANRKAPTVQQKNILEFPMQSAYLYGAKDEDYAFYQEKERPDAISDDETSVFITQSEQISSNDKQLDLLDDALSIRQNNNLCEKANPLQNDTTETVTASLGMCKNSEVIITHENIESIADSSETNEGRQKQKESDTENSSKEISSEKPKGRPTRYPNGSMVRRIPNELLEEITEMLGLVCPKSGMDIAELNRFKTVLRKLCKLK